MVAAMHLLRKKPVILDELVLLVLTNNSNDLSFICSTIGRYVRDHA